MAKADLTATTEATSGRVDIWLWHARLAKTRALAAKWASKRKIHLTHQGRVVRLDKPSRSVHVGDEVMFTIDSRITHVRVLQIGERRGPFSEARALYEDLSPVQDDNPSAI